MSKSGQNPTVGKHQSRALLRYASKKHPSPAQRYASADEEIATAILADEPGALERLEAKLDLELAVLRTPDASNRLRALFEASPADLAAAANAAAKRRKR